MAYLNTIHGIRLGERWLGGHEDEILKEIINWRALEHSAEELRKSFSK